MKIKNKLIKKIIACVMMLFMMFQIFQFSGVKAEVPIDKADLYSKGYIQPFKYKGVLIKIEYVVYKGKDGKEYPAYCINRERPGVTTDYKYTVGVTELMQNNNVWKAISNGFPYKTPSSLGTASEIEAFAATKFASYDAMYGYNWDDFEAVNDQGKRVLQAAKNISNVAKNTSNSKKPSDLSIKPEGNWAIDSKDKNYVSKVYSVSGYESFSKYIVELNENKNVESEIAKITDLNNKEKLEFNTGEKFKVLLPITQLHKDDQLQLKVYAKVDTKPILFGKSPNEDYQNYALTAESFEDGVGSYKDKYYKNNTRLEIYKQDGETKKPIENVVFDVLDENQNIVYSSLKTDKNGKIMIDNLLPGKYYIKEVLAPQDYGMTNELIDVNLKLNEQMIITVDNVKKEKEEKPENPESSYQIKKLPRTGY